jgi:hypothetical protein
MPYSTELFLMVRKKSKEYNWLVCHNGIYMLLIYSQKSITLTIKIGSQENFFLYVAPGWPKTHDVAQIVLELKSLLS